MILGLLSDTHGHLPRTERALDLLRSRGAEHLIHCGDLGGEPIVDLLFEQRETGLPVTAVPGNVDEWDPDLILYTKKLGLPLPRTARLEIDALRIAVFHGHDPREMNALRADAKLDLLFTGHTHVARDDQENGLRIVNPGAVYRARVPSVALFDTRTRECRFLELDA